MTELKFYYMKYSLNPIKITPVTKNFSCYFSASGYFYSRFQKWTGGNSPPPLPASYALEILRFVRKFISSSFVAFDRHLSNHFCPPCGSINKIYLPCNSQHFFS